MGADEISLNDYTEAFNIFNEYIQKINEPSSQNEIHEGYLVNLNEYQAFINLLNELNANQNNSNNTLSENNIYENNNNLELKKLSTINLTEVNDKVIEGQSFIIINIKLFKIICKQNEQEIMNNKVYYKITPTNIILYTQKDFQFKNNKNNIIDASAILELPKNNDINYNKISKDKLYNNYNQNNHYESEIKELRILLNEEKKKNQTLIKENINLNKKINDLNNMYLMLRKNIVDLTNKLQQMNKQKSNCTVSLTFDNIICVNFVSIGIQDIKNYAIPCRDTDLFVRLEEKLNNDYPEYKNYDTYFLVNGRRIRRFKTLKENNIKERDLVCVFRIDDDNLPLNI